jgi:hypothetical protein
LREYVCERRSGKRSGSPQHGQLSGNAAPNASIRCDDDSPSVIN